MIEELERPVETPLQRALVERIRREGPITVEDFMRACLEDGAHGYYRTREAIGAAGDFVTAPEISQAFGELIGIWCAVAWRAMGAPRTVRLVEFGPGRGTLMADLLRAARVVPGFLEALQLKLVEISPRLREAQARALTGTAPALAGRMRWHTSLGEALLEDEAGQGAVIVIGNEFLDALPVRQIVHADGAWHERCVALDAGGALSFVRGPRVAPEASLPAVPPGEGDVFEIRPALAGIAGVLGQRARAGAPTVALFIDYGHAAPGYGATLQAVRRHRYASPLEAPGAADLTAHVDFAALSTLCRAQGLAVDGPLTQGEFLLKLGLAERIEKLMSRARPDQIGALEAGAVRISDPLGMGGRFKAVAVRSRQVPVLPPFLPAAQPAAGGGDGT